MSGGPEHYGLEAVLQHSLEMWCLSQSRCRINAWMSMGKWRCVWTVISLGRERWIHVSVQYHKNRCAKRKSSPKQFFFLFFFFFSFLFFNGWIKIFSISSNTDMYHLPCQVQKVLLLPLFYSSQTSIIKIQMRLHVLFFAHRVNLNILNQLSAFKNGRYCLNIQISSLS